MANNPVKRDLVQSLLLMAYKLRKNMVVEGIQTIEDLNLVANYRPTFVQGYLFHRPEADGPDLRAGIRDRSPAFEKMRPFSPIILHKERSFIDLTG